MLSIKITCLPCVQVSILLFVGLLPLSAADGNPWNALEGLGPPAQSPSELNRLCLDLSSLKLRQMLATMDNSLGVSGWLFEDINPDLSSPILPDDFAPSATPIQEQQNREGPDSDENQSLASQGALSRCAPYTIKWTLCQRKKTRITKLTENAVQNLEEYPSSFWETTFKSDIDTIIDEKRLSNTHEPDETQVVASINARGEENIPKRFPGLDIDWSEVDGQIDNWADLVQGEES